MTAMVIRGLRDLEVVKRLMASAKGALEAGELKDRYEKLGFDFAMSLYGVLTNKETGRSEYRRIEVLSDKLLNATDVELIYRWFQQMHPIQTYSVWLYNTQDQTLKMVFEAW